jgi:UDP-N-acetylglucosamine 2-epimerase (non-hydrolysing)
MKKICIILGTRPEIIKLAPFIKILEEKKKDFFIIFTGQHLYKNMTSIFLSFFNLSKIKYQLRFYPKKNKFFKFAYYKINEILKKEKPDIVVVQGDTYSALLGALSAKNYKNTINNKLFICHIEAGLRSGDFSLPEEANRIIIDNLSDLLFCPTLLQKINLHQENIKKKIFVTGSTIVDSLKFVKIYKTSKVEDYYVLTLHRHELLSNQNKLLKTIKLINNIAIKFNKKIIFPCHPRTKRILQNKKFNLNYNFKISPPLNYKKFINLLYNSKLIITDSGGVQEEACILKKKIITMRNSTERPETLIIGANFLSRFKKKEIYNYINSNKLNYWKHPYGKKPSLKIYNYIEKFTNN